MNRRFIRNPDIVERKIRNEHILVPVMRTEATLDSLFTLNETAQLIWLQAADGRAESEIAAALVSAFGIPADRAAADVRRTLDELLAIGALRPDDGV